MMLIAVFIGTAFYLDGKLRDALFASMDDSLNDNADTIIGIMETKKDMLREGRMELPPGEAVILSSGYYYQVFFDDGSPLWKSPSLAGTTLPYHRERIRASVEPLYETVERGAGETVRILAKRISMGGRHFIILAAGDISQPLTLLASFRDLLWYIFPVFTVAAVAGSLIIVIALLRPLARLSRTVGEITKGDLHGKLPLEEVETEFTTLVIAFNATTSRLDELSLIRDRHLADAAYEIETLLSLIKSNCTSILRKERIGERYRETVEIIDDTVTQVPLLIEKILDVAKVEGRDLVYKREIIDLAQVVRSAYNLILPIAAEKGVTMHLHGCGHSLEIMGDRERLGELFTHLITNSVKYTRRGGAVAVTCTAPKNLLLLRSASLWKVIGWIEVSFADTGIGIADDERDKIFKRFYRIDTPPADEAAGAGLGLTIARAIVDAHGGRIDCASKPAKGSTFTVHLPVNP